MSELPTKTVTFLFTDIAWREQQPMLAALLRPLFTADSGANARLLLGEALERLRQPLPKVATLLEEAEEDLLAFYAFPADHWPKPRFTNPLDATTPHRTFAKDSHRGTSIGERGSDTGRPS